MKKLDFNSVLDVAEQKLKDIVPIGSRTQSKSFVKSLLSGSDGWKNANANALEVVTTKRKDEKVLTLNRNGFIQTFVQRDNTVTVLRPDNNSRPKVMFVDTPLMSIHIHFTFSFLSLTVFF
jgi:hypothetical protein